MPSKIQVDQIAGATGSTVTLPSGQTLDLSSGTVTLPNSAVNLTTKVTGTLPVANGGTGLTTLGSASQVLRVNSGATALEYGTLSAGKLLQIQTATASATASSSNGLSGLSNSTIPANTGTAFITLSFTPTSASSKLLCFANTHMATAGNDQAFGGIFHDGTCIGVDSSNGYASDGGGITIFGFVNSTNTSARNIIVRAMGTMNGSAMLLGGYRGSSTLQISSGIYGTLTVLEIAP